MRNVLFGVFAHPDDEAFGCAGTLIQETRQGTELHLVTLTDGSAGANPDGCNNLGEVRLGEWRAAASVLGATTTHYFGYTDGHLDNEVLIEAADRLEQLVRETVVGRSAIKVEFITLDLNGVTGHIDHIVAARVACLVFYRLKQRVTYMDKIRLCCFSDQHCPAVNTDWLYMEKGREPHEIDEIIDASQYYSEIKKAITLHHTQRSDGQAHLDQRGQEICRNHFIVKT